MSDKEAEAQRTREKGGGRKRKTKREKRRERERKRKIVRCTPVYKKGDREREKATGSPDSDPPKTSPWPPTTKNTPPIMIRL